MLVVFFVILFCVALMLTLIGSYLSSGSRTRVQAGVDYVPRRATSQVERARIARRSSATGQWNQSTVPVGYVGTARRRYASPSERGVASVVGSRSFRFPYWLKITLILGTLFTLFLIFFTQMTNFSILPAMALMGNPSANSAPTPATGPLYADNLGVSGASQAIVRIAQLDESQYSSQDEYNTWAYSACSVASMTEVINAYGHHYHLTDILKVEAGLHEITPELGLLEDKGIYRTMAQFGFRMVPLEQPTLDGAIAVANQGHPIIVGFANSDYWPGGHILVLRGGDAQNVELADSSRLNLTSVPRAQFLQWWTGFTALAVPQ